MAKKECNICKAQVVALHRHMKQMHMQNAHTTDCNHCGKQFSSNRVKEHIRSVHGPATFGCDFCDKMFTTNFKLTSHKKYIHTERNLDYECDACVKQSNNQNAHNVHRSTHNNDRPFKCNLCDSAFKQKIVLLRYERTHTGEKVSCEECNKLFARHAILRKHKIVKHGHAARNAQQAQQIDPGAPQVQPPAPQADPHGQPPAPLG